MRNNRRTRVAAVSYLNTSPLVWGLLHGPQQGLLDVEFCVPSECADRLRDGSADVGIVPVVEVARQGLEALPRTGIACDGAVRSILLISKVPFEQIRTLAADTSSRTSVALSRVILGKRYGAAPEYRPMPPDHEEMLARCDAALVIGDPALRIDPQTLPYLCLDLGQEWKELTGLPMVFALWAGKSENLAPGLAGIFEASCRYGLERVEEIVARESAARGITQELARDYLTRNLTCILGEKEYEGMRTFLAYAAELELIPA